MRVCILRLAMPFFFFCWVFWRACFRLVVRPPSLACTDGRVLARIWNPCRSLSLAGMDPPFPPPACLIAGKNKGGLRPIQVSFTFFVLRSLRSCFLAPSPIQHIIYSYIRARCRMRNMRESAFANRCFVFWHRYRACNDHDHPASSHQCFTSGSAAALFVCRIMSSRYPSLFAGVV